MNLAFIGDGGISRSVRALLDTHAGDRIQITGVISRQDHSAGPSQDEVEDQFQRLMAGQPDMVVECAGHTALKTYGARVLLAGIPLMAVSTGALADPELLGALQAAAIAGKSRVIIPSGAIAGIDGLAAARLGGLTEVRYRGRKPPIAWRGTKAEASLELGKITTATVFFRGSAGQAALDFPQNANVAATIALAGIGFDGTQVELVADPGIKRNIHELSFTGADGTFAFTVENVASAANPKTSALAANSIASALLAITSPIAI